MYVAADLFSHVFAASAAMGSESSALMCNDISVNINNYLLELIPIIILIFIVIYITIMFPEMKATTNRRINRQTRSTEGFVRSPSI